MTAPTLTVVIPAYNSRDHIGAMIDALVEAAGRSPFVTDAILVDDGSTDDTAAVAEAANQGRLPLRVLAQPNRGRFEARRVGIEAATGEWTLLLDSRVVVERDSLAYVGARLAEGRVWNGHVHVEDGGKPLGVFWRLLAELAWSEYFANPRDTSYGLAEFDRFPKGTGLFLVPTLLLRAATAEFVSSYSDLRWANDDTRLIRWIAKRERIHLSPRFSCRYTPRTALDSFVRHARHRGVVFLDGHGDPSSRYFPAVIAFYVLSVALGIAALRRPVIVPLAAAGVGGAAAGMAIAHGRSAGEAGSLALATPIYAAAHGMGMWAGLAQLVRRRLGL